MGEYNCLLIQSADGSTVRHVSFTTHPDLHTMKLQVRRPFGYLQKQMITYIKRSYELDLVRWCKSFDIDEDAETRRIAESLERRGVVAIDRAYDRWVIRPNYDHYVFNDKPE
jgi:hypothetical protein